MPVHNADIAAIFTEIAELLEIQGANPFRIRAYRNAALTIREFGRDLAAMIRNGETLPKIAGIGDDLSCKSREIATTGHCSLLDRLHKELPVTVTELLKIPGLGPKRVRALYEELHIHDTASLRSAAEHGRIQALHGFGAKTEQRILKAIHAQGAHKQRFGRALAAQYAETLAGELRRTRGVHSVDIAGSYRRCKETVGDIDILVTAPSSDAVMRRFTGYDEVQQVLSQGDTRATVILAGGLQVDLRVVEAKSHGAALTYLTGSKAHNIVLRARAQPVRHARQRGCFVELNSQPKRLDLTDTLCRTAKDEGVLVAIDSDAHSTQDLDNLEWGVGQARRGWLLADDVLNTRSLRRLRPLLRQTM